MIGGFKILLAVLPAVIILGLLIVFLLRWCCLRRRRDFVETTDRKESLQSGIKKLHLAYNSSSSRSRLDFRNAHGLHLHEIGDMKKPNYYVIRRGVVAKPLFNWADHRWLVSEAVEHGWPMFAFASYSSAPLSRSATTTTTLWDFCAVCDYEKDGEAEMSWEVGSGSADCMQKIRLNSGIKKIKGNNSPLDFSYVKTNLPLPGPPLGNSSFPQVAYMEITILSGKEDTEANGRTSHEGELTKLIRETAMKAQSDSLVHVNSGNSNIAKIEEGGKGDTGLITLGLIGGGSPPFALPGSYPGSIGFNSNGSVYLDGINLVFEAKKGDWREGNKVIGCGFDPGRKKVFFTVDSELVHVINCKSEEFSSPLYPTLASNIDVTVLVNLGQSAFKYRPANSQRTPNPCFLRPDSAAARAIGYEEDSRELFSMGRIDSQWLATKKNSSSINNNNHNHSGSAIVDMNMDADSEADLFEIVLDDSGTSRLP